jgi:parallel beta-helix repeat protein
MVCLTVGGLSLRVEAAQLPGPSLALFESPYYSCTRNYYVATTGFDSNSGTSSTLPWATLQRANNALATGGAAAGSCINISPGTYSGVALTNGGNLASSTGYVVYRCETMDGCTISGNAGIHGSESFETRQNTSGAPPNYFMFDGFVMAGNNSPNGVAVSVWNGNNGSGVAAHHIWVLNSIVTGFGQSGIGIAASEYYYIIHNKIYSNSNSQCGSQGSGIAINIMHTIPSYTPTADDLKTPNRLLTPTRVIGNSFFHNAVEWNVIYNNALTKCGTASNPTDTDGNGIIFDTNLISGGSTENYPSPSLVAFNVVYNNGGGGIHLYNSAGITVANNSCFNNQLDPGSSGTGRACMDESGGYGSTFINNIAVAIPAASGGNCNVAPPYAKFNFGILGSPAQAPYDTFSNNITYIVGTGCQSDARVYNGDAYSCASNKCATNPRWVNVGTNSPGTETAPPIGSNFALEPGSPAIGYGLVGSYLPTSSIDAGACASSLSQCP